MRRHADFIRAQSRLAEFLASVPSENGDVRYIPPYDKHSFDSAAPSDSRKHFVSRWSEARISGNPSASVPFWHPQFCGLLARFAHNFGSYSTLMNPGTRQIAVGAGTKPDRDGSKPDWRRNKGGIRWEQPRRRPERSEGLRRGCGPAMALPRMRGAGRVPAMKTSNWPTAIPSNLSTASSPTSTRGCSTLPLPPRIWG